MKYFTGIVFVLAMGCEGGKGGGLPPDARALDAPTRDAPLPPPDAPAVEPFLDPTFGEGGIVTGTLKTATRAALSTADAFFVGGEALAPAGACGVARFLADGAVDPAFGNGGVATLQFPNATGCQLGGLAVQGASVLAGVRVFSNPTTVVLCRLTAAGTLDATFGNSAAGVAGCAATDAALAAYGIAVLPDQTIHFGANWELYRFTASGAVAGNLSIFSDDPVFVEPRTAGGIFVAALATTGVEITAYSATHAPIATYGTDGTASASVGAAFQHFAMNRRGDDRVLVGATRNDEELTLVQLAADGAQDPTWGTTGTTTYDVQPGPGETDVRALAIRPNGDAYVFAGNRVLGVDNTGARLAAFGTDGVVDADGLGIMTDTVVQTTGKVVAVGTYDGALQIVRFP